MSGSPPLATELRTSLEVRFVPKAEVYPQQSVQPATRHPSTWAQQAPRRLGTTRTRTDADGSRAIRNGRFQRPVPQLLRIMSYGASIHSHVYNPPITAEVLCKISRGQGWRPGTIVNSAPSQLEIETQLVMDRLLRECFTSK